MLGRRPVFDFAFPDLEMLQRGLRDVVPIACAFPMREGMREGVTPDGRVGILLNAGRCCDEISCME